MTILERYINKDCKIIEENTIENCKREDLSLQSN